MKKSITKTLLSIEFDYKKRLDFVENPYKYLKSCGLTEDEIKDFNNIVENDLLKEQILEENPELGDKFPVMHTQGNDVNTITLGKLEELYG